jgi:undecaprenyl-diphosphatase
MSEMAPMATPKRHRFRVALLIAVALVLGIPLFLGLYQGFDLFGVVAGIGALAVFGLILLLAAVVHPARLFAPELHRFGVFTMSVFEELSRTHPRLAKLRERLSPVSRFVSRRLDTSTPAGLFLTSGVIVTGFLVWEFVSLMFQVISHGTITLLDVRVANLSDLLHAGEHVRASTFFTLIGGAKFRIPFCVGLFGALWLRRPKLRPLIAFLAVLVLAPLAGDVVKDLVRRPRPLAGQVALPGSYSFPSGHAVAAASAFSFLAYFAIRKVRRLSLQLAIALGAAVMIITPGPGPSIARPSTTISATTPTIPTPARQIDIHSRPSQRTWARGSWAPAPAKTTGCAGTG